MKILYVATTSLTINTFFKPHIQMLVNQGNTVEIACNSRELELDSLYGEIDCVCHQIDFSRSPLSLGNIKAYKQLKKILEKSEYDIVHCHTPNAAIITRLVCQKYRKKESLKVYYTAHGFHFYQNAPKFNWMIYYPIEKICSKLTDKLITINKEDYELAKSKFKVKEVCYIPGVGLDLSKFENICVDKKQKRKELGVPDDAFILFSVGELNRNKNHQIIIKALASLNNPKIHYIIAGVGENKNSLLELASSLGVADKVHFIGYRNDIAELNCCADVFCFPSIREGLPVALMEAMACGTPIVCSKIRGNSDLITEETGFLCDPFDYTDFARAISQFIENPNLREEFSEKNLIAVEKYGIGRILDGMRGIYSNE